MDSECADTRADDPLAQLGTLLGGTVILETLFSLPGVGF
jgi:hypothetical protein